MTGAMQKQREAFMFRMLWKLPSWFRNSRWIFHELQDTECAYGLIRPCGTPSKGAEPCLYFSLGPVPALEFSFTYHITMQKNLERRRNMRAS
jgi:hypothetical protein